MSTVLTPKEVSNRIKAKGLLKLRWYCQMCEKQCRDANGFKCHCISESHQRRMEFFAQNPHLLINMFSRTFERSFLDLLRHSHRSSRVSANDVYQEMIRDRYHVHMNSTRWATLTEFITYLGKEGRCKVEDTPRGLFITYINIAAQQDRPSKGKRLKAELADEERHERDIRTQIERAQSQSNSPPSTQTQHPCPDSNPCCGSKVGGTKVSFVLQRSKNSSSQQKAPKLQEDTVAAAAADESSCRKRKREHHLNSDRTKYWLCEGIIVKVTTSAEKGVVTKVTDRRLAEIDLLETERRATVHQDELQTVIPHIGGLVRIVNGRYRGLNARLLSIDTSEYCAKVQIAEGVYKGRVLEAVQYEDVCKLA